MMGSWQILWEVPPTAIRLLTASHPANESWSTPWVLLFHQPPFDPAPAYKQFSHFRVKKTKSEPCF
jgi:hypothetical protein